MKLQIATCSNAIPFFEGLMEEQQEQASQSQDPVIDAFRGKYSTVQ